jgi:hypothetical protein
MSDIGRTDNADQIRSAKLLSIFLNCRKPSHRKKPVTARLSLSEAG